MKELTDTMLGRLREALAHPDLSGTRYRMIRPIASGGMGEVYLVEDESLNRRVALKAGSTALLSRELVRRMLREARIVARLEHPGIVPVHDVGVLPDGRPFFTMKYVEGESLHHHIRRRPPLPELLRMFHKICEAAAFAHAHGVIHRDLKPENIMVGPFGEVLVMDWGIAKIPGNDMRTVPYIVRTTEETGGDGKYEEEIIREGDEREDVMDLPDTVLHADSEAPAQTMADALRDTLNTAQGTVLGTPPYMSPEQAGGDPEKIDTRSDIYALGAILYFMLAGRPPGEGTTGTPDRIPPPRQLDRTIPRRAEAICMKAIAPDPSERYAGAQLLGDEVLRFLDGLPISAYRESPAEKALRWSMKHRFVLLLVLAYMVMRVIVFLAAGN